MPTDETPAWARELRSFTEFSLTQLESRLIKRIDGLDHRIDGLEHRIDGLEHGIGGFENRLTRKLDAMEKRFCDRFDNLERDVASLKSARS